MRFRDALLKKLDATSVSLRKVAEGADVSYEQLKKLKQNQNATTNVEDAIKVSKFFNQSLDEFMSGKDVKIQDDLIQILNQLSPDACQFLETAAKAQLELELELELEAD